MNEIEQAISEFEQRLEVALDWDGADLDYCKAMKLGIKALEKQIPKTPGIVTSKERLRRYCPSCKSLLFSHIYYCFYCGQKLDWSDDNENAGRSIKWT